MVARGAARVAVVLFCTLWCYFEVRAEESPIVPGFERFHAESPDAEGGRLLFNELGCANCHGGFSTGLPQRKGPNLEGATRRLRADWLEAFLAGPSSLKPGTPMPHLVDGEEAEALRHFLARHQGEAVKSPLRRQVNAERGSALFHQSGCVACHAPSDDFHPAEGRPEASAFTYGDIPFPDFPAKTDIHSLTTFLAKPHAVRPDGRMPDFGLDAESAGDIAAHLMDFQGSNATILPRVPGFQSDPALAKAGAEIFAEKRCAACHELPGAGHAEPVAIAAAEGGCLTVSEERGKGERVENVPEYGLSGAQRTALTAWMTEELERASAGVPRREKDQDKEKARGLEGFWTTERSEIDAPQVRPKGKAKPQSKAEPKPEGRAAQVGAANQKEDRADGPSVELTLEALNCVACHERNGAGGPDEARKVYFTGDPGLGDTGRYPPPLTEVGAKLRRDWLENVLAGDSEPVRPYLDTKMPHFGKTVDGLAGKLAEADRRELPPLAEGDAEAGRRLLGSVSGVNCITCHRWDDRPSLGIQALDLSTMHRRYRPRWLRNYLLDPGAYRAGTLMPPLWPGGVASNKEVLGGDTEKQIASILAFARKGEGVPEGYPEVRTGEFEQVPEDRPIVMRSFFEGAGTHAILVGFPEGVHLAYDGLQARPALAWEGRFFDAYHTWFTRSQPFGEPLGEVVMRWRGENSEKCEFKGYKIDDEGIPSFLIEANSARMEETFQPSGDGGLRRVVRLLRGEEAVLEELELSHPEGVSVEEEAGKAGERRFEYRWE